MNFNYDRLKEAKKTVKIIKNVQKCCNHNFGSIIELSPKEYISNTNNSKIISIINSILSIIIVEPKYARICKYCGKVKYFYDLDEAETYL